MKGGLVMDKKTNSQSHTTISKCLEFRLKPNKEQSILIWKTFGCNRLVWNMLLSERIEYEKTNPTKLLNSTPAHLKDKYQFLKEVDSMALINTQLNLNQSCKKLFPKGKAPAFRAKGKDKRSYTTNWIKNNIAIIHVNNDENYIKLPKLGLVRIILHRNIPDGWKIKHATIKETASGKFYVSIAFDVEAVKKPLQRKFDKVEAFDFSMPNLIVSYSGENDISKDDIRWYRNIEGKLRREQKKLSNMQKNSRHYCSQLHKIGKIYEKAKNRRKDFLHKLSYTVASSFDAVVVEDINLQNLSQTLSFGKSIYDNGYGILRNLLAYKLKDRGKVLVKVDKFYPSSKRCSNCGDINNNLTLSDRIWICPTCGVIHNRDKNATINLHSEGLNILRRWTNGQSPLILTSPGVLSGKKLLQ